MSHDLERFLTIEISVNAANPDLLVGLDQWLHLGLIGEAQVKRWSRQYLTCTLPIVQENVDLEVRERGKTFEEVKLVKVATQPNVFVQVWRSFLDELSIRWLLFLGIFLVVVSSGVLAASQWSNFPAVGQYLILWGYTLSFWGIGSCLGQQDDLTLTSQTLQNIAILLVPINFLAMSSFNLSGNLVGWSALAIATMSLTAITYWQYKQKSRLILIWFLPLFLALSYLHLAWEIFSFSTWAVYIGIIAIAISSYYFLIVKQTSYGVSNLLFLLATWSLLLFRALLVDEVGRDFGLAIAIAGWLLAVIYLHQEQQVKLAANKNNQQRQNISIINRTLQPITNFTIGFGWLISLINSLFWQTTAINILAWNLTWQRLSFYWRKRNLLALFIVGLQGIYLVKELIPSQFRKSALSLSAEITKTSYFPESVFGVTLFPYLLLFVAISTWLYRRKKLQLAIFSDGLTFLLGLTLTWLSISNPTWRSLNLFFSTLTLGYVSYIRQPTKRVLIYLSHGLGLLTIANGVYLIFPNLHTLSWGIVCLLFMVAEWIISIAPSASKAHSRYQQIWYGSCWYFGLLASAISYGCFLSAIETNISVNPLAWLLTPVMLTVVGKYTRSIRRRRLSISLSCLALFFAQFLTFTHPITRLISLTVATGLMFANVYYLRRVIVTRIHIGFAFSLIVSLLWGLITGWDWLIFGAIAILSLYQLRKYLITITQSPRLSYISQRTAKGILGVGAEANNFKLIQKYAQAADEWAIILIVIELIILTVAYLSFNLDGNSLGINGIQLIATSLLIGGAVIWRYGKQTFGIYLVAWSVELLVFGLVLLLGGNGLTIAVANIFLGLLSLGLINNSESRLAKLSQIPLIYALLGLLWRLSYFNAYTGWLTLGAAITGIGVSKNGNKQTLYLSLAGISLAIYELVVYQMSRSPGGNLADGFTILSLVAATIALIYRLVAWLWRKRQGQFIFNLSLNKIILIAHIHWAIASILKLIAAGITIETTNPHFTPVSIAVSFFLGAYALIQGRERQPTTTAHSSNDWWIYVGLVEIVATITYSRLIFDKLSLFDPWRVVFTCAIALIIYQIPWHNFGWRSTPWRRTALVIPALMAMVTAESISYISLLVTAVFYLRIAYYQKNLRWSYVTLGFINWGVIRLIWQYNLEFIWYAVIATLSLLYIAQFEPYLQQHKKQRHYLRLAASIIICLVALSYQDTGILPSAIALILTLTGLGLRIRAFLFVGTITFMLTIFYQLVILISTYSFLKWIVSLVAGIIFIAVAANFERKRDRLTTQLKTYFTKLQQWQ